jgi:hypothetical protein
MTLTPSANGKIHCVRCCYLEVRYKFLGIGLLCSNETAAAVEFDIIIPVLS